MILKNIRKKSCGMKKVFLTFAKSKMGVTPLNDE